MPELSKRLGVPSWEFRLVLGRTKIDYDRSKDESNKKKHGHSLSEAVSLLERVLLPGMKPTNLVSTNGYFESGEVRHMHMLANSEESILLMVTTMRSDETVRVISLRKASKKERRIFHEELSRLQPMA